MKKKTFNQLRKKVHQTEWDDGYEQGRQDQYNIMQKECLYYAIEGGYCLKIKGPRFCPKSHKECQLLKEKP